VIAPTFQPDPASQFICDLLRWDQARADVLEAQMTAMDWEAFAQLAAGHLLAGVAYKRLRALAKKVKRRRLLSKPCVQFT